MSKGVPSYKELLVALVRVYESTGPGASEQALPDALKGIDDLIARVEPAMVDEALNA